MIVVDIETTGLEPNENSIVSIGAVDFVNPSRTFYKECRIPAGTKVSKESLKITGLTLKDLKDSGKPTVRVIVKDFLEWCKEAKVKMFAGENPWLDATFLRTTAHRYGIDWPFGHRLVDLHSVCYAHHLKSGVAVPTDKSGEALGLDVILEYLGIHTQRGYHNALTDAKLEAEAFSRIIYRKSLLKEYRKYAIPESILNPTK